MHSGSAALQKNPITQRRAPHGGAVRLPIATLLPGSFAWIASGAGIAVASKAAQASLDRDQPLMWTGSSSARLYQTRRTVPLT
jgi:hypothetical protein